MENENNSVKTLNIVNSIMRNLNNINFNKMLRQLIALRVETDKVLEDIADIIYSKALQKYNFTILYAKLCACMIKDDKFNKLQNSKITFEKILMCKCSKVFFSYKSYHQELDKLKSVFKYSKFMEPKKFRNYILNKFLFEYHNKLLANCIFICELFNQGALRKIIILDCINELLKEENDLQILCLCLILKLIGPKFSRICNLNKVVKYLSSFINENSINNEMSSTLKSLALEIKNMHLNNWINKDSAQLSSIVMPHDSFKKLPPLLRKQYSSKSYDIMAVFIFEECYDVLFNFVNKKEINEVLYLLTTMNTWIYHDQISFVVTTILIAMAESQRVRMDAGELINNLIKNSFLSNYAVQLGVSKVLNDPGIINDFPNVQYLILDITEEFKLK